MIETIIETTDIMEQLRGSIVGSYNTGSEGDTVTNIVTALLAFQKITPLITIGTIEPTDAVAFNVSNITILNALYQLRELVGGYISVNTSKELDWENDIGEDKGQQIRFRKNLKGLVKEVDWGGLYTRFYPSGSGTVKLSDIDILKEVVSKEGADPYGYLTLIPQYACYKDWIGLGENLPDNVSVYRSGAVVSYPPDNFSGSGWGSLFNIRDGNTATYAQYTLPAGSGGYWTTIMQLSLDEEQLCNGVRIWLTSGGTNWLYINRFECQISEDLVDWDYFWSPWIDSSDFDKWLEKSFYGGPRMVKGFRIRMQRYPETYEVEFRIAEMEFRSDYFDNTSKWKQGADERTLRCAFGDYEADDTYHVSYTHADYLKAWDAIKPTGSYEDIAGQKVNPKITYAEALLEWGRLMLTAGKVLPVSYEVQAIMLSECGANFAFEELQLGSIVNVIDEELGIIDVKARVVRIDYPDLRDPSQATIEISSKVSDITDTFKTIFNRL